jgi:hypothetical protein
MHVGFAMVMFIKVSTLSLDMPNHYVDTSKKRLVVQMKETCEVVHVPLGNLLLKQSMQQHLALHHGSMYVHYHVHIPTSGCLVG